MRKAKASAGDDPDKIGRRQARRALGEAGGEGPRDREGDRAARRRSTSRGGAGSCSCASAAASARATSPRGWTAPSCGAAASSSARSTSSWRGASASRSSARTAAARRRWSTRCSAGCRSPRARAGSARACGSARSTRRALGFDGAATLLDAVRRAERHGPAGRALAAGQVRPRAATRSARPARSLSPGERTRASLALLMASGANWLVLDEPTNHLDLPAIEQLETALDAFDGTLLLVTHDRQLLDAVALDRTIELSRAGARSLRARVRDVGRLPRHRHRRGTMLQRRPSRPAIARTMSRHAVPASRSSAHACAPPTRPGGRARLASLTGRGGWTPRPGASPSPSANSARRRVRLGGEHVVRRSLMVQCDIRRGRSAGQRERLGAGIAACSTKNWPLADLAHDRRVHPGRGRRVLARRRPQPRLGARRGAELTGRSSSPAAQLCLTRPPPSPPSAAVNTCGDVRDVEDRQRPRGCPRSRQVPTSVQRGTPGPDARRVRGDAPRRCAA